MSFEIVSTQSWNVLGTFDREDLARRAVHESLTKGNASLYDLVVYISDDAGEPVRELADGKLADWVGSPATRRAAV